MDQVPLLVEIAVALLAAFVGGLLARRVGLPTIVGYLLAGIAIGPFTPGFVGDTATIRQLAELGVILLMFGVGLHFSLRDLSKVQRIAVPGALIRMALTSLLALGLSRLWGWATAAGIVMGLAVSIASTVVLLRGLMDNALLNTPSGQTAVGWVVVEDLATVVMLILMPALASGAGTFDWIGFGLTLLRAVVFLVLALLIGAKVIPWLLRGIAHTRSRELFILAVLTVALGTALGAARLFGVSIALGAFVAGVVISESPLSHQVGADVLPFREAFAVLFFVSIGMLMNPRFLLDHFGSILALAGLIVLGKPLLTILMSLLFSWPARTALIIAAGLSQIGEFSFILGEAGVRLGLLTDDQYSLILAGAILSIMVNPLMFRLVPVAERRLRSSAWWRRLDRVGPSAIPLQGRLAGHVVIIGAGRVGRHIVNVLMELEVPHLVVESDAQRVEDLEQGGTSTLFGDAANSEVLVHAALSQARALVVTTPDEAACALAVATARDLAPEIPIITRAATQDGMRRLSELGAQTVILPELEGGLEITRHLLLELGFPLSHVHRYAEAVRRDYYDLPVNSDEEHRLLRDLLHAVGGIDVTWLRVAQNSPLAGQTLAEANLRARTGASVVAILRDETLMANPKSATVFQAGDQVGLIGDEGQIASASQLLESPA